MSIRDWREFVAMVANNIEKVRVGDILNLVDEKHRDRSHPPHMRWQDLIYLKCPKCSARLEEWRPDRAILYRCPDPEKHFVVSRRKLADILMDESHVLRDHLSDQQRVALAEAIENISQ